MQYPVPTTILINGALTAVGGTWPSFDLRTLSGDAGQILSAGVDGGAFLQLNPAVDNLASYAPATGLYVAPHSIGALSDVDITTTAPVAGDVLAFDAVGGNFVPQAPATYGRANTNSILHTLGAGNVFSSTLNVDAVAATNWLTVGANGVLVAPVASTALTDVSATAATAGQFLVHDGTEYVPGIPSIGAFSDVDLTTAPTVGQVLQLDAAGNFVPVTLPAATAYTGGNTNSATVGVSVGNVITATINEDPNAANLLSVSAAGVLVTAATTQLTDWSTVPATNGQIPVWNNGAGEWTPGMIALNDLTGVNVPAPTDGQVLTWNNGAGEWDAQTPVAEIHFLNADLTGAAAHAHDFGGFAHAWNNVGVFVANASSWEIDATGQISLQSDDSIDLVLGAAADLQINGNPGTAGQRLTSTGANTPPVWADVAPRLLQHNWGYGDYCDTPSGIAPVTNMVAGNLVELSIAATTAPDADEDWEVLRNGVQIATITLANGATTANVVLGAAVATADGDVLSVNPTSATPGTPSTYGSISALLEVA